MTPEICFFYFWVFGGVERESGKYFLVEVPDRTAANLQPVVYPTWITHSIRRITSYAHIDNIQHSIYTHSVVVHQQNFMDPYDPDTHT